MSDFKNRVLAVLLGVMLALTVVACGDDDETPTTSTTIGGDTTSTEPIGS